MKKPEDLELSDIGDLVGEYAEFIIMQEKLTAKMNAELDGVRKRYSEKLENLGSIIKKVENALKRWAKSHKELFVAVRSMDFTRGSIRVTTNPPKVEKLRGIEWEQVATNITDVWNGDIYLRTYREVNKEALLADREMLSPELLKKIGVKITQDETVHIDIKRDDVPDATGRA